MSGERLSATQIEEVLRNFTPNAFMHRLAREVQELRHLRDNVLPDLRQELDNANAALEASRKLVADLTERLQRADGTLLRLAMTDPRPTRADHLLGKAEGVRLALSYLTEMATEAQA